MRAFLVSALLLFSACSAKAFAAKYSPSQMETLVSPIALYPDVLLKNILPAATFPDQITDAALLIQDKSDADLIKSQKWDVSVKVIATYPGVLKMMYGKLIWTTQLGQAFLDQNEQVLDAIQSLRAKAEKVGNLKSDNKQLVSDEKSSSGETIIKIEPTNPEVIYVPENTTTIIYSEPTEVNYVAPLVTFGLGMAVGAAMNDNDDNYNVYYGGGNMWGAGSYNDWADVRRARNEDIHDRQMDRQDFRQDSASSRQDFREDYANNNPGSINKDNLNSIKNNKSAKLESARANMNSRSNLSQRQNVSNTSAFSGMNSGSFSSRASQQGFYSRSGSYGGGSYGGNYGSRAAGVRPGGGSYGGRVGGGGGRGRR